jgi:hypothetical protein
MKTMNEWLDVKDITFIIMTTTDDMPILDCFDSENNHMTISVRFLNVFDIATL